MKTSVLSGIIVKDILVLGPLVGLLVIVIFLSTTDVTLPT